MLDKGFIYKLTSLVAVLLLLATKPNKNTKFVKKVFSLMENNYTMEKAHKVLFFYFYDFLKINLKTKSKSLY